MTDTVYIDEMVDVKVGPVGKTGLPTISNTRLVGDELIKKTLQQEVLERQQTIQWFRNLHPVTRMRLVARYWTWDQKGFKKALLGSTKMSRVILHPALNPAFGIGD